MTSWMLHGDDDVVGSLTSGGTESILMAMKAYRDRAAKLFPHIKRPNMVAPITIHPAHEKAAHYFGFEVIHVPVNRNFVPDLEEFERVRFMPSLFFPAFFNLDMLPYFSSFYLINASC